MMITNIYENLVTNLDELVKLYRLLLDCVRKEKDLLISTDLEKINENTALKEQIIFKIRSLDGLRVNYATELANLLGADSENVRLLELAQKMGGAQGDKLRLFHSTLELIIKRLSDLNAENSKYAESALKNIDTAMNGFKDTLMGQKTYQNKGKYQQGPDKSGHLVTKEA